MKLYKIRTKIKSVQQKFEIPYRVEAYVEAKSAAEAINRFFGGEGARDRYYDCGGRYKAELTKLPEGFWDMADQVRPGYISADGRGKNSA